MSSAAIKLNSKTFQINYSEMLAHQIYNELESKGFCCLENALSADTVLMFQREVDRLIQIHGKRYFSLTNPFDDSSCAFHVLKNDLNFSSFLHKLAKLGVKQNVSQGGILNVLRVVTGEHTDSRSLEFHYDASVVTALIPIYIPDGLPDKSGHLVAVPNLRKIRLFVLINLLEKIFFQNYLIRKITKVVLFWKNPDKYIVKLMPGNAYFFWGYRTLHANLSVDPKNVRATLLFHCGNPHGNSKSIKIILRLRQFYERVLLRFK